ncbi:MAG TPA: molecular chaperone TorD [Rhizobiales bacterium]|nr:molecular chaperone TorD [Hyphomicrobiales bacterium]
MHTPENTRESHTSAPPAVAPVEQEDVLRAQVYRLLARFLSAPPDAASLKQAAALDGDDSEFGNAINSFARLADSFDEATADTEYHDLFIGVTRGELVPFGSYYQTGFLNEKPLAILRRDMARLAVERNKDYKEPEDHIASVMEIMAGLIDGAYGEPLALAEQKKFFDTHVNSWAPHFFADLEEAEYSVLYAPLGTIGRLFIKIEQDAFAMI